MLHTCGEFLNPNANRLTLSVAADLCQCQDRLCLLGMYRLVSLMLLMLRNCLEVCQRSHFLYVRCSVHIGDLFEVVNKVQVQGVLMQLLRMSDLCAGGYAMEHGQSTGLCIACSAQEIVSMLLIKAANMHNQLCLFMKFTKYHFLLFSSVLCLILRPITPSGSQANRSWRC